MAAKSSIPDKTSGGQRFIQSFTKSSSASVATTISTATAADTMLTIHDRVVVSHQDGASWAVAIGTILSLTSSSGGEREVNIVLDKALPSDSSVLYRIDRAPAFSRGSVSSSLAELCSSDSERYSPLLLSIASANARAHVQLFLLFFLLQ